MQPFSYKKNPHDQIKTETKNINRSQKDWSNRDQTRIYHLCLEAEVATAVGKQPLPFGMVAGLVGGLAMASGVDLLFGSMRLTHKKTVISHKLCTHFWSSKLSHKKEKKDKTEWFTHRFSKTKIFFIFPNPLINKQNLLI